MKDTVGTSTKTKKRSHPFRRAVLRGLGVVLPPLLTIVFFLWLWNSVQSYVLQPLGTRTKALIYWKIEEVHKEIPPNARPVNPQETGPGAVFLYKGNRYVVMQSGELVPSEVYRWVFHDLGAEIPATAQSVYDQFIETKYLRPGFVIPIFLCLFILILYLLGKFIAARVGRIILGNAELLISHVPIIRTVYSSVKQVTDFVFSDREIEYTRVVAVEYPRKGLWSIGFVTGESMIALESAASEPVLSVLMPTSPMPATGFTITVRQSETIDLEISLDQAIQFIVSCGVVVPTGQRTEEVREELQALISNQDDAGTPQGAA